MELNSFASLCPSGMKCAFPLRNKGSWRFEYGAAFRLRGPVPYCRFGGMTPAVPHLTKGVIMSFEGGQVLPAGILKQ